MCLVWQRIYQGYSEHLREFIIKCVLPELTVKWFTKPELGRNDESTRNVDPPLDNTSSSDANDPVASINSADLVNAAGDNKDNDLVNTTDNFTSRTILRHRYF